MRRVAIPILACLLLVTAGCFDYEETMVINKDGSGTLKMRYVINRQLVDQMSAMTTQMAQGFTGEAVPENPAESMFAQNDIESFLSDARSDTKLLNYQQTATEASYIWEMTFGFTDIAGLGDVYDAVSVEDKAGIEEVGEAESGERPQIFVKQADGTWLFERRMDEGAAPGGLGQAGSEGDWGGGSEYLDGENGEGEEYAEESESGDVDYSDDNAAMDMAGLDSAMAGLAGGMMEMFSGHKISFSVTFPGEIIESNATSVEGNRATWSFPLEMMESAPPTMRAVVRD